MLSCIFWIRKSSHAPRERVSWNFCITKRIIMKIGHAPRERVSWNFAKLHILFHKKVTLHVSVWVEITHFSNNYIVTRSRSTWACELKFMWTFVNGCIGCHAPRERVSWNIIYDVIVHSPTSRSTWACELKFSRSGNRFFSSGHAPRERVSWNNRCSEKTLSW